MDAREDYPRRLVRVRIHIPSQDLLVEVRVKLMNPQGRFLQYRGNFMPFFNRNFFLTKIDGKWKFETRNWINKKRTYEVNVVFLASS